VIEYSKDLALSMSGSVNDVQPDEENK